MKYIYNLYIPVGAGNESLSLSPSVYLVDIWNVIEAFRENGLNSFEAQAEVNVARLESLLTTVYYHLNKRLPTTSQINTEYSLGLLMNWLLSAYDP